MTQYSDLRDFVSLLERRGQLRRIRQPVSPQLEITEVSDRVLRRQGPALLFERPTGFAMPVLTNLFGTLDRIALGLGLKSADEIRPLGEALALMREAMYSMKRVLPQPVGPFSIIGMRSE